jgi:ketosteroid isomerase-like protein
VEETMSEHANVIVVQRAYAAFGAGDLESLLALLDENVTWVTPGPAEMPTAGRRRGRHEVGQFFHALLSAFDIERFAPKTFIAQDDRVIVLGEETSRVKATGKAVEVRWAHAFTVTNGTIVAFEEYLDTADAVSELRAAQARV